MAFVDRLTADADPNQITMDTIKSWIRVEHDLDNTMLSNLRFVAVNEAFNYTQNDFNHIDDITGELVDDPIPFNVVMACLMLIAYLYENRGESQTALPHNCMKLLNPYKKLVGL